MTRARQKIRLKAARASLEVAMEFVRNFALKCGISQQQLLKLELVVEELVLNVIDYAYQGEEGEFEVVCECREGQVVVEITDWGMAFNPLEAPPPHLENSIEARDPGGLGIYLSKHVAGELAYRREGEANILRIVTGQATAQEGR